MAVVRRALTALYAGEIVDIGSSTDGYLAAELVDATRKVLDQALAGSSCPFQGYEESLGAFSRAIYALRVEGGRCAQPSAPGRCGFYDPYQVYAEPSVRTIRYAGAAQEVGIEITSGVGTDLIDIVLDPAAEGHSLALEFRAAAELDVQVLFLLDVGAGARPRYAPAQQSGAEASVTRAPDGRLLLSIPGIRTAFSNRLGLIVTRLGGAESADWGEYDVLLRSSATP
jgi:hypothetical protein